MNSLNSILIEGNLIADPVRTNPSKGTSMVSFTVEATRDYNQENERKTELTRVNVEVWNRTADLCFKTLSKGRGVRVVGRVKEKDGSLIVVGESVEFKTKFDKKETARV